MKTVLERFGARLEISGMHPTISFNLDRAPGPLPQTVQNQRFSGSATSVRILGKEMLDLFTQHVQQWVPEGWWRGHDPRKRAIQVWRIAAFHPETGLASAPTTGYNKS